MAKYPHQFNNGEDLNLSSKCKAGDPDMQEYPLKQGTYYNGGNQNKKQGPDRVVYLHKQGETDPVENLPQATFCGVMTHTGASDNDFVLCS